MISNDNWYLQIKVSKNAKKFLDEFSKKFDVSISNFGEYCISSVIADLHYRTKDLTDGETWFFYNQFAHDLNNLYKNGKRSK